ncbi:MAG: TonB-dependent receptor [Smithellaceae bacterium]|nr:TonB-dependent receptor [Smithellaceae bacterium]
MFGSALRTARIIAFLIIAFISPFDTVIFAAETPQAAATLEEVVVTATRDSEETRKIPASVTVITSAEIAKSGATTVVDALKSVAGVNFRTSSGNSSQAQIDLRGFGENGFGKTLVLLDGKRLNRPDMSSVNWLEIPLVDVERIEIVRGGGSVLYGDAAIAGTINVITRKGTGALKGAVSAMGGSYGLHDEKVGVSGAAADLSYALDAENQQIDGYRKRSAFSSRGGGANVDYAIGEHLDVSGGVIFNRSDFEMPGYLTKEQMAQDRRQFQPGHNDDDVRDDNIDADATATILFAQAGKMETNLLYKRRLIATNFVSFGSFSDVAIDTYGITPRYVLSGDLAGFDNKLTIGVDFYRETLEKKSFADRERNTLLSQAKLHRNTLGIYLRDEFNLRRDLILALGARTERARVDGCETDTTPSILFDKSKDHDGSAYEAGLTYLLGEKGKVYARVTTLYRYPFLDEQASYYGSAWADGFNESLEAEKGVSYEAGVQFYPLPALQVGISAYFTDMRDEIAYVVDPVTWVGTNVNLDKTRHQGIETNFRYEKDGILCLFGNLTWRDAKFREGAYSGKHIPLVPGVMANAGADIGLPFHITLRPEVRFVGKCYLGGDNANAADELNDYTLVDVFLLYKPQRLNPKISLFAGVENLTDVKYVTLGYDWGTIQAFYPSPEITFKGGMTIEF